MQTQATLTSGVFFKNLAYIPALLLGLSTESYMILTFFMALDFVLGITRAAFFGGPRAIKSYKLAAGVLSKFLVLSVPLIMVWGGRGAGIDFTMLGQWGIGALILSQLYSILGHINAIRLGEDRAEWDAVSVVMSKFRTALEAVLIDSHSKEK